MESGSATIQLRMAMTSPSVCEERLDPARFVRVHRTHIVNLAHVVALRRQDKGLVAEMSDGARVAVSRTKARVFRALGK
jgi:DNA-binding LytR/AlgR family response regulator